MNFTHRVASHLRHAVTRKTAFLVFAGSAAVLLGALLIGGMLMVALVFFYGFGTPAFATHVSPAELVRLKQAGIVLASVGVLSLAGFICGSCLMVASINHTRYRRAYLWFAIIAALLAGGVALRISSY